MITAERRLYLRADTEVRVGWFDEILGLLSGFLRVPPARRSPIARRSLIARRPPIARYPPIGRRLWRAEIRPITKLGLFRVSSRQS